MFCEVNKNSRKGKGGTVRTYHRMRLLGASFSVLHVINDSKFIVIDVRSAVVTVANVLCMYHPVDCVNACERKQSAPAQSDLPTENIVGLWQVTGTSRWSAVGCRPARFPSPFWIR